MVFHWAVEGVSCDQIAERLNEQLTPSKRCEMEHSRYQAPVSAARNET